MTPHHTTPYGPEYFGNISQNSPQRKLTFVHCRGSVDLNALELFHFL
jgi:hypothetical protein